MTSTPLAIAAVLAFAVGGVHSWLGEKRLLGPLLAPGHRHELLEKSAFARQVLRFAWHLTTIAWWGMGAALAAYAMVPVDPSARIVLPILAVTFLMTGVCILLISRGRHLAWPVFLTIAGLSLVPLL